MAFAFGAAGSVASVFVEGGAPTLSVAYPSGITAGQLLLVFYHSRASGNLLSVPSGWESIVYEDTLGRTGLIGRVADGTESGSLSLTFATDGVVAAQMGRWTTSTTGWTLSSQIHATNNAQSASVVDAPTAGVAISAANCLVVVTAGRNTNNTPYTAPPSGFTQIGEYGDTPNFLAFAWAYQIQTTATTVSASFFDSASANAAVTRSTIAAIVAPTPSVGPMTGVISWAFDVVGSLTGAPAFDTAPSMQSQTETTDTIAYNASASATNIYVGAYARGATAPTAAQIEAGTGARGTATEATTGADDTIALTPTDNPKFLPYDIYIVLKGASGYSPVVALLNQFLLTPAGKQKVTLVSIDPYSPLVGSAAVAGDTWVVDILTDGGMAVGISTDGLFTISYAGPNRQIFVHNFYDVSAVQYEGEGEVVVNNKPPNYLEPAVFTSVFTLPRGSPMTPVDLDDYATDPEGDTVTVTLEDPVPGTSIGAGNIWSGTPTTLQAPAAHVFRWTDEYGDYYEEAATVEVGTVVPYVEGLSQSAASSAILAAGLVVALEFQHSETVAVGNVISQSPAAFTVVEEGTPVTITISAAVAPITFRFEMT